MSSEHVTGSLKYDYGRLAGTSSAETIEGFGEHRYRAGGEIREVMHVAMAQCALCAAHLWARKPN